MFNLSGSEVVVLLLLALIVLGPERLPEAARSFARIYGQLRRMGEGFQSEMRSALEEPLRELRDTADLARRAVTEFPDDDVDEPGSNGTASEATGTQRPASPAPQAPPSQAPPSQAPPSQPPGHTS